MEIAVVSPLVMKFGVGSVRSMEEELLCMVRQEELLGSGVESIGMLLLERGALSGNTVLSFMIGRRCSLDKRLWAPSGIRFRGSWMKLGGLKKSVEFS